MLPQFVGDDDVLASKRYVSLFSWFGLVLGFLHIVDGRFTGVVQIAIASIGLYATWSNTPDRGVAVALCALTWCLWAIVEIIYAIIVLAATSTALSSLLAGLVDSGSSMDLRAPFDSFLKVVHQDVTGFVIFSVMASLAFDCFAAFTATRLWSEVIAYNAAPAERAPLMQQRREPRRAPPSFGGSSPQTVGNFGSFGRTPPPDAAPKPRVTPFQGRGHRLGAE